jgi:hypothetical protein
MEMAQLRLASSRAQFRPSLDTSLGLSESLRIAFDENRFRKGRTEPCATTQVSLKASRPGPSICRAAWAVRKISPGCRRRAPRSAPSRPSSTSTPTPGCGSRPGSILRFPASRPRVCWRSPWHGVPTCRRADVPTCRCARRPAASLAGRTLAVEGARQSPALGLPVRVLEPVQPSGPNPGQFAHKRSSSATVMLHVNVPLVAGDGRGVDRAEHMALLALEQVHDDLEAQQARVASELRTLGIHLTPRSGGARAGPARAGPWTPAPGGGSRAVGARRAGSDGPCDERTQHLAPDAHRLPGGAGGPRLDLFPPAACSGRALKPPGAPGRGGPVARR